MNLKLLSIPKEQRQNYLTASFIARKNSADLIPKISQRLKVLLAVFAFGLMPYMANAQNDPTVTLVSAFTRYTENDPAIILNSDIIVMDLDNDNLIGATVRMRGFSPGDELILTNPGPFSSSFADLGGTVGLLTITGTGSVAQMQTALRSVTYRNTGDDSSRGGVQNTRAVNYTVTDATSATGAVDNYLIAVSSRNDVPTMTSLPSDIAVNQNTASNVDLSAATFADPDAGNNSVTLTITAGQGILAASTSGGVTIGGSGSATLTLTGSAGNIETFLNTASNIQYTGPVALTGNNATTLSLSANDGGNSGAASGVDTALGTVNVDITAMTPPSIPVVDITTTPIACAGGPVLINWTGTLNDAARWHIYTGSCGGTQIGTTTSNSLALSSPSSAGSITYFVRGEGGGVTPGSCGSDAITTVALENADFSYSAASYLTTDADPTPTITGVTGGDFSRSPTGLIINASTGEIDVSASTPGMYTVTYESPGICEGEEDRSVTIVAPDITWNGSAWSNTTGPTFSDNAILAGNYNIATGNITADNLTVNSGVILTMGSGSISLNGNFENNGNTFSQTGGTFTFNGAGNQSISGDNSFRNLTIDNSAGVTLNSATDVTGVLNLQDGTLTSNGNLTLKSTGTGANQTARVDFSGSG